MYSDRLVSVPLAVALGNLLNLVSATVFRFAKQNIYAHLESILFEMNMII